MSRSPRQTAAFSLFTFLDVMLCTLGALIIVLICVVRTAQIKNADEAPETVAEIEEIESQRETAEWRAKHLAASRDKAREQLQDRRLELSHVEEHSRRLRAQLAELDAAEATLAKDPGHDPQLEQLRSEVQRLGELATAAERDLEEIRREADSKRPNYAVVPYEGPSQTMRRPLYIECVADRIILQPENIELTPQDFLGPLGPGNPLAAGLRAAREYLLSARTASLADSGEPYPLLLVRPDGVEAYYAAREAMSSWGSEFGYEFIDQDWKLEYRTPDPELVDSMRLAVDEARLRQRALARAAPRLKSEKGGSQWYRAAPSGGVVQEGRPSGADDGPSGNPWASRRGGSSGRGNYAQGSGNGRGNSNNGGGGAGNGTGNSADRYARGSGSRGGGGGGSGQPGMGESSETSEAELASIYGAASAGSGYGTASGTAGGAPGAANPGSPNGVNGTANGLNPSVGNGFAATGGTAAGGTLGSGSAAGNSMLASGTGPGGTAPSFLGDGGSGGQTMPGTGGMSDGPALTANGYPSGGSALAPGASATTPAAGGSAGDKLLGGGLPAGAGGGGTAGDMTGGSVADGGAAGGGGQQLGAGTAAINGATAGASPGGNGAGQGPSGANGGQTAQAGANVPGAANAANSAAGNTAGNGGTGNGQGNGKAGQQGAGVLGQQVGGAAAGQGNSSGMTGMMSSKSSASSAQSSGGSSSSSSSSQQGSPGGMPNMNMEFGQQQQTQPTASGSMANSRGKNWSLPEEARHTVPISRPVRVECRADRLVLRSEQNPAQSKEIPLGERTEDSIEELVSSVWQRVDTWGSAGRGMYWRPQLSVVVAPGAEGRFTDLKTLMADSGLEVKSATQPAAQATKPKRKLVPW